MTTHEVNTNQSFLGKLKQRSKSVPLENFINLDKKYNLSEKWAAEKKLIDDITNSQSCTENLTLNNIRSVLRHTADQIPSCKGSSSFKQSEFLLSLLVDRISSALAAAHRKEQLTDHKNEILRSKSSLNMDEFSCQSCCELLYNPVTLSCSHSFCQACIVNDRMKACIVCNKQLQQDIAKTYKINIILAKILQKWHSLEWYGRTLMMAGLDLFNNKEYEESVKLLTQALDLIPNSHIATLHRAKAYYFLNKLDQALEDSVKASLLAQKWPEVHYVKGEILYKLGCFEESLLSLLICLVLDPNNAFARDRIEEIINNFIGPVQEKSLAKCGSDPEVFSRQSDNYNTSSKRSLSLCESGPTAKTKSLRQDSNEDVAQTDPTTQDLIVSDKVTSLAIEKQRESIIELLLGKNCGSMANRATRVFLNFELSYNKKHNEVLLGNALGTFPSIACELGKALDAALYEIDNCATRDLHMLQNDCVDEELMKLVDIQLPLKPRVVDSKLIDSSDFECSLCMRLFYDPICTPCGHMFCQLCIERSLDHKTQCPLCKCSMQDYLAESLIKRHPTCDYASKSIIQQYLPDAFEERVKQHQEEMNELQERQPIFVCTIAFPSVPCPLHIFEPRYRLMLRRCLDYNESEFGMCMPDESNKHHPVGTLLKVRDVTFFPDGRSVVDSIGSRRFTTSNSQLKDGYNVAKINFIVDVKVADVSVIENLSRKVYSEAQAWFEKLQTHVKDRILQHFGSFPVRDDKINSENGPDWAWWVLAILPVEDKVKVTILGKNKLQERLLIIHRIFTCLHLRSKPSKES